MKPLEFLAGRWRGDPKMYVSPTEVRPFTIVETAAFILDGTVLQMEGVATAVVDGQSRTVGRGLGLVHYDSKSAACRMRHYEANGAIFDTTVTIAGGRMAYESTDSEGTRLRVDIRIDADGRWTERVDRFHPQAGWQLFREYELRRTSTGSASHTQASIPRAVASSGPYFGQPAPGVTPALFAPDVVAAMQMTRTPVFTVGGREVFWSTSLGQNKGRLMTARLGAGGWSAAEALPFSTGEYFDHNPAPSPDGTRLVFASNRPIAGKDATAMPGTTIATSDLWLSERTTTGWSAPVALGPEINTSSDDDVPVLTRDGTLYFGSSRPGAPGPAAIYRSRFVNGTYAPPELVPSPITTPAGEMFNYIAPDESLLIYLSFRSGTDGGLHVSFRQADGAWGTPIKLGDAVASLRAYFLTMSPEGERLFFTSTPKGGSPQIYWVDAKLIRDLRDSGPTNSSARRQPGLPEGMVFVRIAPGRFLMGSDTGKDDEKPVHQVRVTRPFFMQTTPVTRSQFRAFVEATGYRTEAELGDGAFVWTTDWEKKVDANWKNPYFQQDDRHPVVCVSWNDAQAFVQWLNTVDPGRGYRLPTEAEYEYAARAGSGSPFFWGDDPEQAVRYGNTTDAAARRVNPAWNGISGDDGFAFTSPVAQFKPNAWALFDMVGNILAWCQDWYGPYAQEPATDPAGPASGKERVLRGTSWHSNAAGARTAYRTRFPPDRRHAFLGFRVVATSQIEVVHDDSNVIPCVRQIPASAKGTRSK